MLIPGLLGLFVIGPTALTGMLGGLNFPIPAFFTWVLILAEIFFGIAILAKWKLEYTSIGPAVILVIAALAVNINWSNIGQSQWPIFILHLAVASNYLLVGAKYKQIQKM